MKTLLRMAAITAATLSLGACMIRFQGSITHILRGEGPCIDSTFSLEPFHSLYVLDNLEVEFVQTPDRFAVEASLPRNLMDSLQISAIPGRLQLSFGDNNVVWQPEYKIRVLAPAQTKYALEGSGVLHIPTLEEPGCELALTGSGDMVLGQVQVPYLSVKLAGSGHLQLSSLQGGYLRMEMAGSGDIGVQEMAADSVRASVAGSGDIILGGTVSCWTDLSVAGSGDINARGLNCPDFRTRVAGSGDILRP